MKTLLSGEVKTVDLFFLIEKFHLAAFHKIMLRLLICSIRSFKTYSCWVEYSKV